MPRETVEVEFEEIAVENDRGSGTTPGLRARCTQCDQTVEVRGQSDGSTRAACAKLRDDCEEPGDGRWYEPSD